MKKAWLYLILPIFLPYIAEAQIIDEEIASNKKASKHWVVVVEDDRSLAYPAQASNNGTHIQLNALVPGLQPDRALALGVAEFDDGEVISTQLHQHGIEELAVESFAASQARVKELEQSIVSAQRRIVALEGEIYLENIALRKKAKLDPIDLIYEKIDQIEQKIAGIRDNK